MTNLSPAAQAVLNAIDFDEMSGPQQIVACARAAAALRAAALYTKRDSLILLSIADELEQFNA